MFTHADTVLQILDIVSELQNTAQNLSAGVHHRKISEAVSAGRPIQMILPAFPAKSSNRQKTLGILPDFGEVLALKRLNELCETIAQIYEPGARLVVCSDGRVFSDLVQVSDDAVDDYSRGIATILEEYKLSRLSTFNLEDVFAEFATYDQMRSALVRNYGESVDLIRERVARESDALQLFNGIHRFLFEDFSVLFPHLSRNQLRVTTKTYAYEVIQRSNAWSRLVEGQFGQALRLSIHPQAEASAKIGIRLLSSDDRWRTPWHSAVLFDGQEYRLVRRQEAEQMNATLTQADGKYPYFVARGAAAGA